VRLFVALDIPEETRRQLRSLMEDFAKICRGARWAHPEGLHITLKFIGHVDDSMRADIQKALSCVPPRRPLEVSFRDFGFFPNEKHPHVFFVGIDAGKDLAALSAEIEHRLAPLRIPKESRVFQPHLTLARFKTTEGLPEMRKKLAILPAPDFGGGAVSEFYLYQSMLKSGGALYTKLSTYHFAN
jgi:RNA 2',3'-cyclic 3'-phosphodiesterase